MFGITVEVRDKTLARLGQIRPEDLSLSITERYNNVGEWTLTIAATHPMTATLRTPGAGLIVTRDDTGTTLMSGPVVMPESAASASDPGGTVKISGVTDTVLLADRLAYPQPSNVDPTTQTASHDERTGTAEALMYAYVGANIGPSAPAARRDTRLTLGTNGGRGPTVTKRARFPVLGTLLSELATAAGLGFRVVQVGSNLEFQTYAVNDRSATVRLDIANNTLASHKVATAPPGATHVIVGGPGELTARSFAEVTTTASLAAATAWGRRIEEFLDRRSDDPAALTQAGLDELADKGFAQTSVQIVPAENTSMRFGPDWFLGDRVTVVVEGVELSSVVTGYILRADSDGYRIGTLLGDPSGFTTDTAGRIASIDSRVSNLELNSEGAGTNGVAVTKAATTDDAVTVKVTGDTQPRYIVNADGKTEWGSGTAAPDTNLYRGSANALVTDDGFTALGNIYTFGGVNAAGDVTVQGFGAAQPKIKLSGSSSNAGILFSDGTAAPDTNLYRASSAMLKTDASLTVATDLTVNGAADIPGLYVASNIKTSGNTTIVAGGSAIHHTVTFTAVSGKRYTATWEGRVQFTVAGSATLANIRHASGSAITLTSTIVASRQAAGQVNNGWLPWSITAEFVATASGTYTAGITFSFFSGSGNLNIQAGVNDESYFRISRA